MIGGVDLEVYDFGLRLQELRKSKGLSQADVARKLKVAKGTISSYERNLKTPRLELLVEMAVLYNASVDYILGLTNRTNLYLDDLPEKHQRIIFQTLSTLKDELTKD